MMWLFSTVRPRHVWLSVPCGQWSSMQRIDRRNADRIRCLEAKRRVSRRMLRHEEEAAGLALRLGCEVHDEHPALATPWQEPPKVRMAAQLFRARLDGRTVGTRGPGPSSRRSLRWPGPWTASAAEATCTPRWKGGRP